MSGIRRCASSTHRCSTSRTSSPRSRQAMIGEFDYLTLTWVSGTTNLSIRGCPKLFFGERTGPCFPRGPLCCPNLKLVLGGSILTGTGAWAKELQPAESPTRNANFFLKLRLRQPNPKMPYTANAHSLTSLSRTSWQWIPGSCHPPLLLVLHVLLLPVFSSSRLQCQS